MSDSDYQFALRHGFTVSDEILMAIGCTVVCQSSIENQIGNLIIDLLGTDSQKGYALTSGMSFRNLCATLSSLILQVIKETDPKYKRFKELVSNLHHFEQFRNQVAHSLWAHSQGFNAQRAMRYKITSKQGKGVRHHLEEIEIERISEEIEKANLANAELVLLIAKITGKPIPKIEM